MVPAVLIESEPRSMLHVVAVAGGSSTDEWIDLDDLDQLAHPPAVAEAIRRSVAEYRGSSARPAGRPDWFHPDWQAGVDAWIDDVSGRHRCPAKRAERGDQVLEPVGDREGPGHRDRRATTRSSSRPPARCFAPSPLSPSSWPASRRESVPDLLAVDTERGWMLMRAFEHDDDERQARAAVPAAREIARLQVILADRIGELLDIGAPDRRLAEHRRRADQDHHRQRRT